MCKIEHRIQETFQMKKMNKYFVCLKKKKQKDWNLVRKFDNENIMNLVL